MSLKYFVFFIVLSLYADSFITKDEYAAMLYSNPRGIGCNKCHGESGKGLILGRYQDKNRTVVIKAPDITNLSYKRFYEGLTKKDHKLMPYYFLTNYEIKTLYYYLQKKRKK